MLGGHGQARQRSNGRPCRTTRSSSSCRSTAGSKAQTSTRRSAPPTSLQFASCPANNASTYGSQRANPGLGMRYHDHFLGADPIRRRHEVPWFTEADEDIRLGIIGKHDGSIGRGTVVGGFSQGYAAEVAWTVNEMRRVSAGEAQPASARASRNPR